MSIWDAEYPLIQEEASIQEHSDNDRPINYLVKAIDGGSERAQIKCQIDLDEWKNTLTVGYNSGSKTVLQIVQSVAPTGWAVVDQSGITYKRTVQLESATPLDVLEQCRSTFVNVTYRFDNVAKTVTIISMANGQNLGAFATRDLNLKENNYKGKSTGFITRLYAYGKDGLSFASINGGKAYVENYAYSSRVICGFWKDERYTVAANLLAYAQARLAEMAVPARSFECNVVDLAAVNPQKYGFLDFTLFSVVSLIDATRSGAKIEHRVIERWRYPYLPEQNKVTLSTVAPRIQSQVAQAINNFNNPNSVWQQQQRSAQQNAIENATSQITGAKGGNMRAIYDSSGNWTELVVMNTENILTASKLWRFNIGGFGYSPNGYNGPYTTAITMDGAIVADFITTGTLNAGLVSVINLDASNITTGTLNAGLVSVINLDASNITTGTLNADRIAAHSLGVGKITGSLNGGISNSWGIDFQSGTLQIGNISAANITTGTLSADRIAANSISVSKLTGSITNGNWKIDLDAGTLTIGNISANNITAGTINADNINVTNINGANVKAGTIGSAPLAAECVTAAKVKAYDLGTDQISTGGLNNRCFASGSIYTSTCDSTIQGYFADVIETQKLYAGTAVVSNLRANYVKADYFGFSNTGTPHKLVWNGAGQPILGG
jgi:phage minor structural protein